MRLIACMAAALLAGCQTYSPRPLDLSSHQRVWAQRDVASADVAAYARALAGTTDDPGTFNPADGVSLAEARAIALFFNPELRLARARARVQAVSAAEAGRWQDPALRVDAERIISSVAHPWVVGGLLELTLPLSGTPTAEKALAEAEADVAKAGALLEEHRILLELDRAWAELAVLDQRIQLADTFTKDLASAVEQAQRLQKAGEMGALEAGLFRIEQGRRQAELRSLTPRRREQAIAVKALMGFTPDAPVELQVALPTAQFKGHLATVAGRLAWLTANHPKLQQVRQQYQVAERSLALEIRRQYPDLAIGGGYGRDEGTNRILGGLGIPIPVFNANRQAIAQARAKRDAARASAEAQLELLVSALAQAEAALEAAHLRRESLEQEVAPLVDEQLRTARELNRLGNVEPVVVFETLTRAYEARLEVLEAAAAEATAVNQINSQLRPGMGVQQMTEAR